MYRKLIILLLISVAGTLWAAKNTYEPEIGYNTTQQIFRGVGGDQFDEANAYHGARIGIGAYFDLPSRHSIKTGLYYSQKGGGYRADNNGTLQTVNTEMTWLEIPVTIITQIGKSRFSLTYGFYTAFLLDASAKVGGTSVDIASDIRQDYGVSVGVRYDYKTWVFGAQIQDSFTDIYESSDLYIQQRALTLSAGVKF